MRGFNKYLFKSKWHVFSFFFYKRILNFKRPKWKKIQRPIVRCLNNFKFFKKKMLTFKVIKFFKYIFFFKRKIKQKFTFNFKFVKFFKRLKRFLVSKKFTGLKILIKSKLKFLKKKLKKRQKFNYRRFLSFFFFDFKHFHLSSHLWLRSRFIFKNLLFMKAAVIKYFYGCFKVFFFQKQKAVTHHTKNLSFTLIKPEYRLDILLWRLKIFKSPYLARFAITNKQILLNNSTLYSYYFKKISTVFLRGGDIISLRLGLNYSFRQNKAFVAKTLFLPYTMELDYYANNFILLKALYELNFKDINSLIKEPLCSLKFKDYIKN